MTVTSRSLARDTMLALAQHAEDAMVAFRNRDKLAVAVGSERAMFQHAVQAYLKQAASGSDETRADLDWSNRSIALRNAADILGFCAFMGTELPDQHDVEELYRARSRNCGRSARENRRSTGSPRSPPPIGW